MTAIPRLAPGSRRAVATYARRNPYLDIRDLAQEASLAALEAGRTWRTGGASSDLYEAYAVAQRLSRFVAESRSPVHVPDHKGKVDSEDRRRYEEAAMAPRVPVTVAGPAGSRDAHELVSLAAEQWTHMEDRLDAARAAAEVRRILDAESEAAKAVLLGEEKSASVAERMRMSRAEVYAQTARAVRRLRAAFAGWEVAA